MSRFIVLVTLLLVLAAIPGLCGYAVWSNAKSAVHEIEALIFYLIASVFIGSAVIVVAIDSVRLAILERRQAARQPQAASDEGNEDPEFRAWRRSQAAQRSA